MCRKVPNITARWSESDKTSLRSLLYGWASQITPFVFVLLIKNSSIQRSCVDRHFDRIFCRNFLRGTCVWSEMKTLFRCDAGFPLQAFPRKASMATRQARIFTGTHPTAFLTSPNLLLKCSFYNYIVDIFRVGHVTARALTRVGHVILTRPTRTQVNFLGKSVNFWSENDQSTRFRQS